MSAVVQVSQGKLRGKSCETENHYQYWMFKGIPYAKPPVGELRFAAPLPADPWDGVRDATTDCNVCAQFNMYTNTYSGEEDCLLLNVYTPTLRAASTTSQQLPVIFYIHGGAYLFGYGTNELQLGPDFLIEKEVVVVTVNYRLGVLGFLSLENKDALGNMGLKDQAMAMIWVKENINEFGGDPGNVTIVGCSAGGASVLYHLLSPMSAGLFHKAIAQSGSPLCYWAHNNKIKEIAFKIPALKGINITDKDELLRYLKELPTRDLVTLSVQALEYMEWLGGPEYAFVPTVEIEGEWETFLSKPAMELLSEGNFHNVPLITGCCKDEGTVMLSYDRPNFFKLEHDKEFVCHLPFQLPEAQKSTTQNKFADVYLNTASTTRAERGGLEFVTQFFTDMMFLGSNYLTSRYIAKHNPVYYYMFTYVGGLNVSKYAPQLAGYVGASHGDDIGYIFKKDVLPLTENISTTDHLVRDRMTTMWTNFAKYGEPTPERARSSLLTTQWTPASALTAPYLTIDAELTVAQDLYPERMMLFKELLDKYPSIHSS